MTSKARQNVEGGLGVLPLKNLKQRSSDLLNTSLIFVPQLTLQVGMYTSPTKVKKHILPKATVELIASFFWFETGLLASFLD